MAFRRAIWLGAILTILMLVFLATGLVTGIVELALWAVALILGWVWLLRLARPRGTR
ncbi:MAG: hypothetical protein KDB62_09040 [Solirubrobacterales bacterium]|nr:hypothetical protein [Solirubrobacterales bacterium]